MKENYENIAKEDWHGWLAHECELNESNRSAEWANGIFATNTIRPHAFRCGCNLVAFFILDVQFEKQKNETSQPIWKRSEKKICNDIIGFNCHFKIVVQQKYWQKMSRSAWKTHSYLSMDVVSSLKLAKYMSYHICSALGTDKFLQMQ